MPVNVDKSIAEKTLLSAFRTRCPGNDEITDVIAKILTGTHKTYKYILITGLLGKASNEDVNPLALQAKAPFDGAYDARTLCHDVIVPFERDFLDNALGGSNEPFVNKPARFTHLSIDNAVRRGTDFNTLKSLIGIFETIKTSEDAARYLACALETIGSRIEELRKLKDATSNYDPTIIEIYEFLFRLMEKSFEGATCVIVVATLEKLYHEALASEYVVVPHKVNQSGSSSKEVGDIDIMLADTFHYAIEVKDKPFNTYDFEHAMKKMIDNGASKGQFICGPNAEFKEDDIKSKISDYQEKGFPILFQDVHSYARTMIFKADIPDKEEVFATVVKCATEINASDSVYSWIQEVAKSLGWK